MMNGLSYNNNTYQRKTQHRQQQQQQQHRLHFKFLLLGAAGAGKTCILRRYFYNKFEYDRVPTLGSDFYVGKIQHPNYNDNNEQEISINVQIWDTPGRENFSLKKHKSSIHYSASMADSFFTHADGIMLVYDMTSSTSFTRLLKWYGDLMELFRKTNKQLPILIVANKLDLFQDNKPGARLPPKRVPQRDVLGLNGTYYGNDFQYEYSVSPPITSATDISIDEGSYDGGGGGGSSTGGGSSSNMQQQQQHQQQHRPSVDHSTTDKSEQQQQKKKKNKHSNKRRMEISTYLVNRDNWTTDGSYLESLLHSEDGSHPDREMVLLWCMRNALTMYEVSAATGEGIKEAIEALVTLTLEAKASAIAAARNSDNNGGFDTTITTTTIITNGHHNKELDLNQRYAPKQNNCLGFLPPFRKCMNNR